MTKGQAILEILLDARKTRRHSTAAAKRVVKCCDALGLTQAERLQVLGYLEYCNTAGEPYGAAVKRVW